MTLFSSSYFRVYAWRTSPKAKRSTYFGLWLFKIWRESGGNVCMRIHTPLVSVHFGFGIDAFFVTPLIYKLICGHCRAKIRATIQNMGSVPDCPYCHHEMLVDGVHIPLIKRLQNVVTKAKDFGKRGLRYFAKNE